MKKKLPRIDKYPEAHKDEFDVLLDTMDSLEHDFIGKVESGSWFYVDPFVGCAWEYEDRNALLGKWVRVKGFWSLNSKNGTPIFLVDEGGIKIT